MNPFEGNPAVPKVRAGAGDDSSTVKGVDFAVRAESAELHRVLDDLMTAGTAARRLLAEGDLDPSSRSLLEHLLRHLGDLPEVEVADASTENNRQDLDHAAASLDRKLAAADRAAAAHDRAQAAVDRAQARSDELTGALLRRPGVAALQLEIERCRRNNGRLVCGFVDVDGLKAINDRHGHRAGDDLLREVVRVLRANTRSYDLVVRYGGDEFLCILTGDSGSGDITVDRLAADLANLAGPYGPASATVGFAELQPNDTLEGLIARADASLYDRRMNDRSKSTWPM
jgi:diguanylate cyclase (GGDEF)-like protein